MITDILRNHRETYHLIGRNKESPGNLNKLLEIGPNNAFALRKPIA